MKRVVLVGPGHAHLFVLESFAKRPSDWERVDLTLVSIEPTQRYSGMLSGHLAGDYPEEALTFDLEAICRNIGATLVTGGAVELDVPRRYVRTAGGRILDFDLLSVDIGSMPANDDVPGVAEHALRVKPIHRALDLRRALDSTGPLIVAGGGLAGVEVALCIRARSRRPVRIVSPSEHLPAEAPDALVRVVERKLRKTGIQWTPHARVTRVEADHVTLSSGESLPADDVLWLTGSRAPTLLRASGAALDDHGYLRVWDTLQSTSHDYLFAAGDSAGFAHRKGVPKSGVYSVRQGPVLARNLVERLAKGPLLPYEPQESALALINCGAGTGIASWRGLAAEGRWVQRLKDRIDRKFMRRFQALGEGAPKKRLVELSAETAPSPDA